MAAETAIPKGTRDFGPFEMVRRNYIFDSIKRVFKKYGYLPLETPAMENLTTLLGKYGEEGDRLLFRILNSGDYLKKTKRDELEDIGSLELLNLICEKGLKYDLTVPFARVVVQHRNEITFPFKRFQIQPVWRADRPQKGRYREFYQCDVDVIGSNSLFNEYELILIIDEVFSELGINNTIKLNNRKILLGIAELIGEKDRLTDITVAIDKIEKIGIDRVNEELEQKGIPQQAIKRLQPVLFLEGDNRQKLHKLKEILKDSETGLAGLDEMLRLLDYLDRNKLKSEIEIDLTLARGLNYYTGAIIEVKAKDYAIGSICGGGRYDDLAGVFGLKDVSGVGVSFGADRIYDVMLKLDLFPERGGEDVKVLLVNFGGEDELYALDALKILRENGISSEMYPDPVKMKKQMNYANSRNIPFVLIAGEEERRMGEYTLKDMKTGEQSGVKPGALIQKLK